jgi:ribosomal protein S18 acetylase RimI-like enzyme
MLKILPFESGDLHAIVAFVEAIQEHERMSILDLKPGADIGRSYAETLVRTVAERSGLIVIAKADGQPVGFACAWIDEDDDPLVREEVRRHAYVSDIFVDPGWRRRGLGRMLLDAIEGVMRRRGCQRIRICSKAANREAVSFYRGLAMTRTRSPFQSELSRTTLSSTTRDSCRAWPPISRTCSPSAR